MAENIVGFIGFSLGVLIVCVTLRMLFAPFRFVFRVVLNSILGAVILVILNLFSSHTGVFIGINPINALVTGLLGVPGLLLLVILQAVF